MEQSVKKEPIGKGLFVAVSKNHSFGTDAVLLSNFASDKKVKKHCDLGLGCGIISMLLLREEVAAETFGVDISKEAVELSRYTADEYSGGKFTPVLADLKNLRGILPFCVNST